MPYGADTEANSVMTSLLAGVSFALPAIDLTNPLYQLPTPGTLDDAITRLSVEDLTSGTTDGTGVFDVLMRANKAHIQQEFEKGRLTGENYARVYLGMVEGAMAQSTAFLLGRDASYWQAVVAQQQALRAQAETVTARVQLEAAKMQLHTLRLEALTAEANFALTKLKLGSESIAFGVAKYQLDTMLPAQLLLLQEQKEVQRAQTLDTRTDGTSIVGVLGKQRDLYTQQITSYQRDAEVKAAKLFTDAWITMKTIDEGLVAPPSFANASLDAILSSLKTNNGIG